MKEIKLVANTIWCGLAIIISSIIIAGAGVFVALEYNRTQWDIANLQKKAIVNAAEIQADGQRNAGKSIGRGVCMSGNDNTWMIC